MSNTHLRPLFLALSLVLGGCGMGWFAEDPPEEPSVSAEAVAEQGAAAEEAGSEATAPDSSAQVPSPTSPPEDTSAAAGLDSTTAQDPASVDARIDRLLT